MDQQVRTTTTEQEGERRREMREVEAIFDTKSWHKLAARPEIFFQLKIPRLAMNAYMRQMVHGVDRSFNPLLYVLSQEGFKAVYRRDQWIRSTWPLFRERAQPYENGGPFDKERMEAEQIYMNNANRASGAIDAFGAGDADAGLAHLFDVYHVNAHMAAEMEARRKAEDKKTDVLLKKRAAISQAAGVDGVMYALGKSEQAQREFLRKGEAWRNFRPGLQQQYQQWYSAPNPLAGSTPSQQYQYPSQGTNTFTPTSDYSQQQQQQYFSR
jgi:hypothetical protein